MHVIKDIPLMLTEGNSGFSNTKELSRRSRIISSGDYQNDGMLIKSNFKKLWGLGVGRRPILMEVILMWTIPFVEWQLRELCANCLLDCQLGEQGLRMAWQWRHIVLWNGVTEWRNLATLSNLVWHLCDNCVIKIVWGRYDIILRIWHNFGFKWLAARVK